MIPSGRPDPEIFGKLALDAGEIRDLLEAKTYLHRGLKVVLVDETVTPVRRDELEHDGGLADYPRTRRPPSRSSVGS